MSTAAPSDPKDKQYTGPAWRWRPEIQGAADAAYEEIGEDRGWPGIPPYEIFEAIINTETQGIHRRADGSIVVPRDANGNEIPMPHGTVQGVMQISPGGGIAYAYEQAAQVSLNPQSLADPEFNIKVGVVGLAEKAREVQFDGILPGGERGTSSWPGVARIAWYGAGEQLPGGYWGKTPTVNGAGNGDAWEAGIKAYVDGFDTRDNINAGDWRAAGDATRESFRPFQHDFMSGIDDWVEGTYGDAKGWVGDQIPDIPTPGDILGGIEAAIPRVAMIGAGIALLVGGLLLVKQLAIGAAVG